MKIIDMGFPKFQLIPPIRWRQLKIKLFQRNSLFVWKYGYTTRLKIKTPTTLDTLSLMLFYNILGRLEDIPLIKHMTTFRASNLLRQITDLQYEGKT